MMIGVWSLAPRRRRQIDRPSSPLFPEITAQQIAQAGIVVDDENLLTGIFHGANGNDKNTALRRGIPSIATDGYIIYRTMRTVCRTRGYTALAVPQNRLIVDRREGTGVQCGCLLSIVAQ
jgi:hypothetical protein